MSDDAKPTITLLDLPSLVYPLWHESSREPDPDWTSTRALADARRMAARSEYFAVCVDKGAPFRKTLDPSYKANRPEKEGPLLHQLAVTRDRLEADGYPILGADGFEADDIIATVAALAMENSYSVVIASSDKDLAQLVSDAAGIKTYSLKSGTTYDEAEVFKKYGVWPAQMRDYLALTGDTSDNIPGVKGIGPKRAAAILSRFQTIDGLLTYLIDGGEPCEEITPMMRGVLTASTEIIARCRSLVTLRTDAPITWQQAIEQTAPTPASGETMADLIEQMEKEEPKTEPAPPFDPSQAFTEGPKEGEPSKASKAEFVGSTYGDTHAPRALAPLAPKVEIEPYEGAWERQLEPRTANHAMIIAKSLHQSRLFSAWGSEHAVLAIILAGRELGVGMMAALQGFHNMEGRPYIGAALIRAAVLASGKAEYLICTERTPERATWKTRRKGDPEEVTLTYTIQEAQASGRVRPNSGWTKDPADMVAKTGSTKICRLVYSDVLFGYYSVEEMGGDEL